MNPATEIVLRWLFTDSGLDDSLADELLGVLKAGSEEREADALKAVGDYVEQARNRSKEPPFDRIIPLAIGIHDELTQMDAALHNLSRFKEMDRLIEKMPDSPMGKRVVTTKLKSLISELVV